MTTDGGRNCSRIRELIDHYLDECLLQEQADEIKAHLEHCPVCALEVREIQAFDEAAAAIEKKVPSSGLAGKIMQAVREQEAPARVPRTETASTWSSFWSFLRTRPKRLVLTSAALACAVLLLVPSLLQDRHATRKFHAAVTLKQGSFSIEHKGAVISSRSIQSVDIPNRCDLNLRPGDRIVAHEASLVLVEMPGTVNIDLSPETAVELSPVFASLLHGRAHMRFLPLQELFRVSTPHLTAGIVGTEIDITVRPDMTELKLLSGKILVSAAGVPARPVAAPAVVTAVAEGTLSIAPGQTSSPARKPEPTASQDSPTGSTRAPEQSDSTGDEHIRTGDSSDTGPGPAGGSHTGIEPDGTDPPGSDHIDSPDEIESPRDILKP